MKNILKTIAVLALLTVPSHASPRPAWHGFTDQSMVADYFQVDSMGNYISDTNLSIDAPWDGTNFQFGFYVYDPLTELPTGFTLATGSGITYNTTTQVITFGLNTPTKTYVDAAIAGLPAAPVTSVNGQTGTVSLTIPAAQVNSDWSAGSGLAQILNKPTLFSGAYSDLTGKPTLFSGAYSDLTGKPTIPAAQINSDWNAVSGLSQIFNKPTIPTIPGNATTSTAGLESAADKTKLDAVRSFANTPSRTIQTVAAAANGWQLSSTLDSLVSYSVTISTTVSLSGGGAGYVVFEICSTNSATAANWIEIGRVTSSQTGTLVVTLVLTQIGGGTLAGMVPAGYYCRLRSVASTGSPTFGFSSGQEVLQKP